MLLSKNSIINKNIIIIITCCILFIFDQIIKFNVVNFINNESKISIISFLNLFNIVYLKNSGIALGIFYNKNLIIIIIITIFLINSIIWMYLNWNKFNYLKKYSLCIIITGGFCNLVDRVLYGGVIDYLDIGIKTIRWPVFNLADLLIILSIILFFLSSI
ncbi:MAG: signal peptidase II [Endomicrobium sp.]|jgi:signal peptidase II|nr:signal peptidase II [Endomicrobium sp.]